MSLSVKAQSKETNKHNCNVSSIICHNDVVISGSDDGKIKLSKFTRFIVVKNCIWKSNLELMSELDAVGGVLSLAACENTLYSSTSAGTIQSWDLIAMKSTGHLSSTLCQPQKLYVDEASKLLWAGDIQGNVAKFENGSECCKYELIEEIWDVMVTCNPPLIYTARDRDVVIAEIKTGSSGTRIFVQKTFQGRSPMCTTGNRLCFFDRDGRKVLIYENNLEKNFPFLSEIPASDLIINAIASATDNIIYTGGYDSTAKKWDLNSLKCTGSVNLNCCINAIATRSENEAFIARSDGEITLVGA